MRDFLRANGVYLPKQNERVLVELQKVLDTPTFTLWTPEEIRAQLDIIGKFNSWWNPNNIVDEAAMMITPRMTTPNL